MKKSIFFFLFTFLVIGNAKAQEWMTSLDIAKRLALVQNKMIFAIWEDATLDGYPVLVNDQNGNLRIVNFWKHLTLDGYPDGYPVLKNDQNGNLRIENLLDNKKLNEIIWEYFVPVIIKESSYQDLFNKIDGKRKESYIQKFNDDSIKIMDVNGNIINTNSHNENYILSFIAKYSFNTSFLKHNLITYSTDQNFMTSYHLASKYIDFTSFTDKNIRSEIIELSSIYLDEAKGFLDSGDSKNRIISIQAIELLRIKQFLFLNKPKKVLRRLRKMNDTEIHQANQPLFNFLHYTAFKLLKDENNADLWKNKVSLVDLKKAKLIIKNNS